MNRACELNEVNNMSLIQIDKIAIISKLDKLFKTICKNNTSLNF